MTRSFVAALALATAAAVAGIAATPACSAPTLVRLPNGLRVVLAPDSGATAVDVATWYDAGARTVTAPLAGIRPVVERLLYLGTAEGARARSLTSEGGISGSVTTADAIVFWETMPAQSLALALRTEAERMSSRAIAPGAFEVALRSARIEARARRDFSPLATGLTALAADVFRGEPYARPFSADDASLARVRPELASAWASAHVNAGSAVLTIVGRFDPAATLALVRRTFGALPHGPAAAPAPPPVRHLGDRRLRGTAPIPGALLLAGWRLPVGSDADAAAMDLIATGLGGSDGSRLDQSLREAFSGGGGGRCGIDRRLGGSMFWAIAFPRTEGDSTLAARMLLDAVNAMSRDTLAAGELERARAQLVTSELFRAQDLHSRASLLADAVLAGKDPALAFRRDAELAKVTPRDVQRVAARLLGDTSRSVIWLVPAGGAE